MILNKIICKVIGHDWLFPYALLKTRQITLADYKCSRCGIRRSDCPEEVKEVEKRNRELKELREAQEEKE